jgi:hypothetical protein
MNSSLVRLSALHEQSGAVSLLWMQLHLPGLIAERKITIIPYGRGRFHLNLLWENILCQEDDFGTEPFSLAFPLWMAVQ